MSNGHMSWQLTHFDGMCQDVELDSDENALFRGRMCRHRALCG